MTRTIATAVLLAALIAVPAATAQTPGNNGNGNGTADERQTGQERAEARRQAAADRRTERAALRNARRTARADCRAERRALGPAAFREKYGRRASFVRCVRQQAPATRRDVRNAARECKAERDETGLEAFAEKYGTNEDNSNAYGKCVSQTARAMAIQRRADVRNAARECRAERSEIGREPFADRYGTGSRKRNAFGRCVSRKAREAAAERRREAESEESEV